MPVTHQARIPASPVILSGDAPLPAPFQRPVIAIGNFDGVHRGHQSVLAAARALAEQQNTCALALTFEPHPQLFFAPQRIMFRLTPPDLKASLLQAFGMDASIQLAFDATIAGMSASDFILDILIDRFQAAGIVVGHDFHFGKGREGSPAFLTRFLADRALPVTVVERVDDGHAPVSSSAIRAALGEGDVAAANRLLGYRWLVQAEVVHGDARGRLLGYPTANMRLDGGCGLRHGIYAVRARVDGIVREGVASFGRRPTFDDGAPLLETHLFNFSGDLYSSRPEVEFVAWLRPELKFDSIEALIEQMDRDSANARAALAETKDAPSSLIG